MPAHDTISQAAASTAAPEAAGKENVFDLGFGFLGNHHSIDFMPFGKVSLPYLFFDNGSFHYFGGEESLVASGQYTTDMSKETSPIGEKGKAVRKDGTPIGLDLSITSNLLFLLLGTIVTFLVVRTAAAK